MASVPRAVIRLVSRTKRSGRKGAVSRPPVSVIIWQAALIKGKFHMSKEIFADYGSTFLFRLCDCPGGTGAGRSPTLIFLLVLAVMPVFRCQPGLEEVKSTRLYMGTMVEITALGPDREKLDEAVDAAFSEIERVERLMGGLRDDSDVSRINKAAGGGPVAYCAVKHVTKPRGAGPGQVLYSQNKLLHLDVEPARLARLMQGG